ncbi:TetM/TetW/TetO/TetS family tetracycline resistance ribosomal protection protein [Paenibacillus sp. MMS20-IR301]|uniref:TetM/TetW/TetO/TetS family tetracycline resistance ribosomal protection protein n=1 Tax=Paenibacillus sp. MMS20-IR301 TaxID=2895946 RepID=UPI0028EE5108|nr:TetM/TetW/TetO/TetS family tetracycline resistance ribosomal protection protein [Paenibacillus sp. MMS20-IR301]WNS45375.1 TetM/TetW/TetO/TetS family tetracycline resistance ribosomal protection protein [Paenibacillus sp. MMS20-IR301]
MNNITVGLLAHVDAGKTTFAEQLLYHTEAIRSRGRVDHQDTFMDTHEIEKARGITVFADQAEFQYKESRYFLLDTPGHVDFSPEMERCLQVLDYAVVILSAVEGVESHTETVWQLLRQYNIPTLFFINKTDRTGANPLRVLDEIRQLLSKDALLLPPNPEEALGEELKSFIAERDDSLLEAFLEGDLTDAATWSALTAMVKRAEIFPCLQGSALLDQGVDEFLEYLDKLAYTEYDYQQPFAGRVYKVRHDEKGTRITYIKALQGVLKNREHLAYGAEPERLSERVTGIRKYNGVKYSSADWAAAGELFAVTGLSEALPGTSAGELQEAQGSGLIPTLKSKVLFAPPVHLKELLHAFGQLGAEDPSLNVSWDEELQELHIHVMGGIQLEILEQIMAERFRIAVAFGPPEILYKETIADTVYGCGHFEPLGHYAEVHLKLEAGERGSGIVYINSCHPDDLAVGYQHQIGQHLLESGHHGLLTGSPLTDLKITLLSGRAHNKHTSGGDFREAALRALRQGLEQAENLLLEPVYELKIRIDPDYVGKVMSDIQQASGSFLPPELTESKAVITGTVPVATFMNYGVRLASMTQGKGSLSLRVAGYQPCHQTVTVIKQRNYNKNADPVYSSTSIFCAKGQAYPVPWEEAESHMHITVRKQKEQIQQ